MPAPVAHHRVEEHMGTVVSLTVHGVDDATVERFSARIRALEPLLSRFRSGSDVARLERGELRIDDADPIVREVLQRCEDLRRLTDGDFDHEPRARSGDDRAPVLDVNALAKGWIVEEAAMVLRVAGATQLCVNAGGDVVVAGAERGEPWRVGIQHPEVRGAMLAVIELTDGAVATSGTYERGAHLRGRAPEGLVSVTVVGPYLATADALSTAVFAGGAPRPPWWDRVAADHALLTVTADGELRWEPAHHGNLAELRFD
jgi:thiamine biosynthesis lipoprotein